LYIIFELCLRRVAVNVLYRTLYKKNPQQPIKANGGWVDGTPHVSKWLAQLLAATPTQLQHVTAK